jgi:hypothetical protein
MKHADTHHIIDPLQHGLCQRRSCETQLIEFIEDVTTNLSEGKLTDTLIMDFSKAFNKVSHSLLLHTHQYRIRGKINKWIENFLLGRTQNVVTLCRRTVRCSTGIGPRPMPVLILHRRYATQHGINSTPICR